MSSINESLLTAWLRLSTSVINSRLVTELSFNESLVCNILYKNQMEHPEKKITATELCNITRILKSQMNRILNQLEKKKVIIRERSEKDKRQVFVKMDLLHADIYCKQHEKILEIVNEVTSRLGEEKAKETIEILTQVSEITDELIEY